MPQTRSRFEPLAARHNRATFSCGVDALDRYLHQKAGQDVRRHLAAVFVLEINESNLIVGYYTLIATSIQTTDLPDAFRKKFPRAALPGVLLGRLAVDSRYQGRGFGELLLVDALRRALTQSDQIAAMAVVVDAKGNKARTFYEQYGFERFTDDEHRLFIPMASIAQLRPSDEQSS